MMSPPPPIPWYLKGQESQLLQVPAPIQSCQRKGHVSEVHQTAGILEGETETRRCRAQRCILAPALDFGFSHFSAWGDSGHLLLSKL